MIIESNRWIRNGIVISTESVKILFVNPILFAYAVAPVAMVLLWQIFVGMPALSLSDNINEALVRYNTTLGVFAVFTVIALMVGTFFACCLARHTMRILRHQPASIHESFSWVFSHGKQIIAWILVEVFISFAWLNFVPASAYGFVALASLIGAIFFLGFLSFVLLLFKLQIVIPIISTEQIEIIPAIKRSSHVVWNNLGTYIVMLFSSAILAILLYAIPATIIGLFVGLQTFVQSIWNAQVILLLSLPLFTIANTLFYYEFYIKRDIELEEIMFTSHV